MSHDGAWHEEIEIELREAEELSYNGTITMQEAKYEIYRDCLGFKDFKNFNGVRFSFKGIRIVMFKLKEQVNVDQLIDKQFFTYKRKFKKKGKLENIEINFKI